MSLMVCGSFVFQNLFAPLDPPHKQRIARQQAQRLLVLVQGVGQPVVLQKIVAFAEEPLGFFALEGAEGLFGFVFFCNGHTL